MKVFLKDKRNTTNHTKLIWFLFIFFTSVYFSGAVGILNSSDAAQYSLARALGEENTFKINNYLKWVNPDYAVKNGNYYSLRPVGESLFMIPFYLWGKTINSLANYPFNLRTYPGITIDSKLEALTTSGNAIFGALCVVAIYFLSFALTGNRPTSFAGAIIFGLGTLHWRYASYFQRFPFAIFFLLLSIWLILKFHKRSKSHTYSSLAGLSLGLILLVDPSLVLIAGFLLVLFVSLYLKHRARVKYIAILLACFTIPFSVLLTYNKAVFGSYFASGYRFHSKSWYRNVKEYFSIPLFPSPVTNLFSSKPISKNVFSNKFWNNPKFRFDEGMKYAAQKNYKGIFIQSPFLIFSVLGLLSLIRIRKKSVFLLLVFIAITILGQNSKYIAFYAPNSFDTHYFLPAVAILAVGFALWLAWLKNTKSGIKPLLIILTLISVVVSLYNGWFSAVTNYAPHVTGDQRFNPLYIYAFILSGQKILESFIVLLYYTFPNIYNLHLLYIILIVPIIVVWRVFDFLGNKLKKASEK